MIMKTGRGGKLASGDLLPLLDLAEQLLDAEQWALDGGPLAERELEIGETRVSSHKFTSQNVKVRVSTPISKCTESCVKP